MYVGRFGCQPSHCPDVFKAPHAGIVCNYDALTLHPSAASPMA
jgi:hypothetical protein